MEEKQTEEQKKQYSPEIEEVLDKIENWTVLKLKEFKDAYEDRFDVKATAAVMPSAMPAATGEKEEEAEEKTSFNVVLKEIGEKRIQVIKTVRSLTTLGLKEAKSLVDKTPVEVLENVEKETAEDAKKKLEEAGATISVE